MSTKDGSKGSPVVGVRLPVWAGSTFPVLGGVVDYMRLNGPWRLVTENDSYGEMESVQIGEGWQGDGLLLYRATEAELKDFRERGVAVVLLSTEGPDMGFPRVVPDNELVGRHAAEHLMGVGLQSFAYVGRGETMYLEEEFAPGQRVYPRERLAGFSATLATAGHEAMTHYLPGVPLWKKGSWRKVEDQVAGFLSELPLPFGLFAVDDALGAVSIRAARRLGLRVPEDIAVLGFGDDLNYCHITEPAMTSIPYPARKAGLLAAEYLARQMRGEVLDGEVRRVAVDHAIARESTGFLAIEDEETAKLVRWIRLRAKYENIQVTDLEQQTNYSLSSIKSRFKKYLGHSPKEEITRVRLGHLKHLLSDESLSLNEIAYAMRFSSPHEMSRFFVRGTGVRPSAFRDQLVGPSRGRK
ncbi:substrate-binding domain-containing protein [Verrucomicrobiaceae bacterium N1E253]|uniref:Substrate-binding domain-containing protein n=1 Tax=Oceaniferula marina TaxID=2748318 RepID=A0A851GGH8_9BACT|nr:substrate-binding domain-containing protein [Oceaniferula marina]NWK56466.1 substrate-binding domain-containing protein [Oceaniferula marina]